MNNKKKFGILTNTWRLNSILLNNQYIKEEITKEMRKRFKMQEKEDTTYKILRNTTNAADRGKCIGINTYIKKEERSHINNLNLRH